MRVSTAYHNISGGAYFTLMIMQYKWRIVLSFIAFIVMMLSLSFCDVRWALVLMMCIFIVIPMIMSIIYISEALRPEARFSIRRHKIDISPQGLEFSFCDVEEDAVQQAQKVGFDNFRKVFLQKEGIALRFCTGNAFLYIPFSAFSSIDDARSAYEILCESIHQS